MKFTWENHDFDTEGMKKKTIAMSPWMLSFSYDASKWTVPIDELDEAVIDFFGELMHE